METLVSTGFSGVTYWSSGVWSDPIQDDDKDLERRQVSWGTQVGLTVWKNYIKGTDEVNNK